LRPQFEAKQERGSINRCALHSIISGQLSSVVLSWLTDF